MKYVTRTIQIKTATVKLYDGTNIIEETVDVTSCRDNGKVIEKYVEAKTGMKVLKVDIAVTERIYRMPLKQFMETAEEVNVGQEELGA